MKKDSIQTRKRKPKGSSSSSTSNPPSSQPYNIPGKVVPNGTAASNGKPTARNYPNFSGITSSVPQTSSQFSTPFYSLAGDALHNQHHPQLSPPIAHHHNSVLNANYAHAGIHVASVANPFANELLPMSSNLTNVPTGHHPY